MFTSENWKQQKCLSIRDRSSTLKGFSNMKHDATLDCSRMLITMEIR